MSPTEKIPAGIEGSETTLVTRDKTVAHFDARMPEVFGTPLMIFLMEVAASNAIRPYLPDGWVSVGTEVNVKHLAPTPVGRTVTATAKVTAIDRFSVSFAVFAHDGFEKIGEGTHVRGVIDVDRFMRRVEAKRVDAK